MKTKQLIEDFEVCCFWTTFLQKIQSSLATEYVYYKTGTVKISKITSVINKLTDYYKLHLPNYEKSRLYNSNIPTAVIHFFYSKTDEVFFIIMSRYGINGSADSLFFEREKYADARIKKNRIKFHCYEAVQIQKQAIENTPIKADLSWTWQLTREELRRLKEEFARVNRHGNMLIVKQLCYGLRRLIGFHGIRQQYYELRTFFEKEFVRINKKPLRDICYLPEKLNYVKKVSEDEKWCLSRVIKHFSTLPVPENLMKEGT